MSTPLAPTASQDADSTKFTILILISLSHFLNDTTQSLLVPTYPIFKDAFSLTFTQIGFITLAYQLTASLLQPLVGYYADKKSRPFTLPAGMLFSLSGILLISMAWSYHWVLAGAMLLGTGSSVFHPESSRVARMASGGRYGLAQSIFQVGGNAGTSCGPLLAAAFIIPYGQRALGWFAVLPLIGFLCLVKISLWARGRMRAAGTKQMSSRISPVSRPVVVRTLGVLLILIFSKYFYLSSISSYFIFYLNHKFGISVQAAQYRLFIFLFAMAAGTLLGGPIGDRIGRKWVIWASILGVAPFTLALPHLGLHMTSVFVFIIGFVLASAFAAIVVFAQELMPGRVGTVAGLFFGFSFGLGGLGAAALGWLADQKGIEYVYHVCAFLPLLGIFAVFLPNLKQDR